MKRILFILMFFLFPLQLYTAPKLSIRITGKWTITLKATNLVGSIGGNDFVNDQESAANEISITITNTAGPTAPWRMDISRVDTTWDPDLVLYARKTADGTGDGTVSGGTVYQEVTNTDQLFFTGTGDRSKIEVQYKISGISINNILVTTYTTTIYYTVTEL